MASLPRCSSCRGFLPATVGSCPNCGALVSAGMADRIGFWLKAAGGASVAMTLMACYGVPPDPYDPTDTDPSEGTGGASGDTEPATSSSGGADSSGGTASSGGAESSGGTESATEGTGGSDGSTGAGVEVEPPRPR